MYDVYVTTAVAPETRVNCSPYTNEQARDSARYHFSFPDTIGVRIVKAEK